MAATKVVYRTPAGLKYKTIIPTATVRADVEVYMHSNYNSSIEIVSIRPSKKASYSGVANVLIKPSRKHTGKREVL